MTAVAPFCPACGTTKPSDFAYWATERFSKGRKGSYCRGCNVVVHTVDSSGVRVRKTRGGLIADLRKESKVYNQINKRRDEEEAS